MPKCKADYNDDAELAGESDHYLVEREDCEETMKKMKKRKK